MARSVKYRVVQLFVICLCVGSEARTDPTLDAVIANVYLNEQLFSDIDLKYHWTWTVGDTPDEQYPIRNRRHEIHFVLQGPKIFFDCRRVDQHSNGELAKVDSTLGFDGVTYRSVSSDGVANVGSKCDIPHEAVRPHTLPLGYSDADQYVTLSDYLKARELGDYDLVWSVEGTNVIDGLQCTIVACREFRKPKPERPRALAFLRRLWLCLDRNYLPIKQVTFHAWNGPLDESRPISDGRVTEFQQIESGIWAPRTWIDKQFHEPSLFLRNKQYINGTFRYEIERVTLNPSYDDDFFRHVPFPPGTRVLEIDGGTILKDYTIPSPPAPIPARSILAVSAIILCAATAILLAWYRWRYRLT